MDIEEANRRIGRTTDKGKQMQQSVQGGEGPAKQQLMTSSASSEQCAIADKRVIGDMGHLHKALVRPDFRSKVGSTKN